jgi:hypothetical protein
MSNTGKNFRLFAEQLSGSKASTNRIAMEPRETDADRARRLANVANNQKEFKEANAAKFEKQNNTDDDLVVKANALQFITQCSALIMKDKCKRQGIFPADNGKLRCIEHSKHSEIATDQLPSVSPFDRQRHLKLTVDHTHLQEGAGRDRIVEFAHFDIHQQQPFAVLPKTQQRVTCQENGCNLIEDLVIQPGGSSHLRHLCYAHAQDFHRYISDMKRDPRCMSQETITVCINKLGYVLCNRHRVAYPLVEDTHYMPFTSGRWHRCTTCPVSWTPTLPKKKKVSKKKSSKKKSSKKKSSKKKKAKVSLPRSGKEEANMDEDDDGEQKFADDEEDDDIIASGVAGEGEEEEEEGAQPAGIRYVAGLVAFQNTFKGITSNKCYILSETCPWNKPANFSRIKKTAAADEIPREDTVPQIEYYTAVAPGAEFNDGAGYITKSRSKTPMGAGINQLARLEVKTVKLVLVDHDASTSVGTVRCVGTVDSIDSMYISVPTDQIDLYFPDNGSELTGHWQIAPEAISGIAWLNDYCAANPGDVYVLDRCKVTCETAHVPVEKSVSDIEHMTTLTHALVFAFLFDMSGAQTAALASIIRLLHRNKVIPQSEDKDHVAKFWRSEATTDDQKEKFVSCCTLVIYCIEYVQSFLSKLHFRQLPHCSPFQSHVTSTLRAVRDAVVLDSLLDYLAHALATCRVLRTGILLRSAFIARDSAIFSNVALSACIPVIWERMVAYFTPEKSASDRSSPHMRIVLGSKYKFPPEHQYMKVIAPAFMRMTKLTAQRYALSAAIERAAHTKRELRTEPVFAKSLQPQPGTVYRRASVVNTISRAKTAPFRYTGPYALNMDKYLSRVHEEFIASSSSASLDEERKQDEGASSSSSSSSSSFLDAGEFNYSESIPSSSSSSAAADNGEVKYNEDASSSSSSSSSANAGEFKHNEDASSSSSSSSSFAIPQRSTEPTLNPHAFAGEIMYRVVHSHSADAFRTFDTSKVFSVDASLLPSGSSITVPQTAVRKEMKTLKQKSVQTYGEKIAKELNSILAPRRPGARVVKLKAKMDAGVNDTAALDSAAEAKDQEEDNGKTETREYHLCSADLIRRKVLEKMPKVVDFRQRVNAYVDDATQTVRLDMYVNVAAADLPLGPLPPSVLNPLELLKESRRRDTVHQQRAAAAVQLLSNPEREQEEDEEEEEKTYQQSSVPSFSFPSAAASSSSSSSSSDARYFSAASSSSSSARYFSAASSSSSSSSSYVQEEPSSSSSSSSSSSYVEEEPSSSSSSSSSSVSWQLDGMVLPNLANTGKEERKDDGVIGAAQPVSFPN